jgi:hypothetical protein
LELEAIMAECDPSVPYCEDTSDEWLADIENILAKHPWTDTDEPWSVTFDCPRCCHPITKTLYIVPKFNIRFESNIAILCQCDEPHEGRDDDKKGCGYGGTFLRPDLRADN